MDDHFRQWRDRGLLEYDRTLTPMRPPRDPRSGVVLQAAWSEEQSASAAAEKVAEWRKDDPTLSIGMLCRENRQAHLMKSVLADRGIDCVTYTGGQFYQAPAVREFRSLLEAVSDSSNDAALLELLQTRWGGGIAADTPPGVLGLTAAELADWTAAAVSITDWPTRIREFARKSFDRRDLEPLRTRVRLIQSMTRQTCRLNVVTSLLAAFAPGGTGAGGDARRTGATTGALATW